MDRYKNYNPVKEKVKTYMRPLLPIYHFVRDVIKTIKNKPQNTKRYLRSKRELENLKNSHQGERCFIIGNGPSLRGQDLDKLRNEICFGSNRIYNIFSDTEWRPTFYCALDAGLICDAYKEIGENELGEKFVACLELEKYPKIDGANYVKIIEEKFYPEPPKFSDNVAECIYEGNTVTYMCIQLAVYMGFTEIYLLGVDHNYSATLSPDGKIEKHADVTDHFSDADKMLSVPPLYKSTLAYQAAKDYADAHGIRIMNATRGGKLEVFERIDFDNLFSNQDDSTNDKKAD